MFAKIFALFVLLAVAFAAPSPKADPQVVTYTGGLDYVYPASAYPYASPYAAAPLAYSAYPGATVFVR